MTHKNFFFFLKGGTLMCHSEPQPAWTLGRRTQMKRRSMPCGHQTVYLCASSMFLFFFVFLLLSEERNLISLRINSVALVLAPSSPRWEPFWGRGPKAWHSAFTQRFKGTADWSASLPPTGRPLTLKSSGMRSLDVLRKLRM